MTRLAWRLLREARAVAAQSAGRSAERVVGHDRPRAVDVVGDRRDQLVDRVVADPRRAAAPRTRSRAARRAARRPRSRAGTPPRATARRRTSGSCRHRSRSCSGARELSHARVDPLPGQQQPRPRAEVGGRIAEPLPPAVPRGHLAVEHEAPPSAVARPRRDRPPASASRIDDDDTVRPPSSNKRHALPRSGRTGHPSRQRRHRAHRLEAEREVRTHRRMHVRGRLRRARRERSPRPGSARTSG